MKETMKKVFTGILSEVIVLSGIIISPNAVDTAKADA